MNYYRLITISGTIVADGTGIFFSVGQRLVIIGELWKVISITTDLNAYPPCSTHSTVVVEEILS